MERISYYNKNIKFNRQALTEVYEILQEYEDDISEIPEKYMYVIEDNMDKDYIFSTEDLEDIELLEDMIMMAFKDAAKKVDADKEKKLGKYGQGLAGLM